MKRKKTDEEKPSKPINKPRFVLTNEARFYLASQDITTDADEEGLFFIASLFLPVKKGMVLLEPHIEIATFDDPDSSLIYYNTVEKLAKENAATETGQIYATQIANFKGKER